MAYYENFIDIEKPRELVFNYLAVPSNWPEFMPTTTEVRPVINRSLNVGDQVTEVLNVLGSKLDIQWTCKTNDFPSSYEIEGICQKRGGSRALISFEFSGDNGVTNIKRVIQFRFDNPIMRLFDPIWKFYFIYEARGCFKRAKEILESKGN